MRVELGLGQFVSQPAPAEVAFQYHRRGGGPAVQGAAQGIPLAVLEALPPDNPLLPVTCRDFTEGPMDIRADPCWAAFRFRGCLLVPTSTRLG